MKHIQPRSERNFEKSLAYLKKKYGPKTIIKAKDMNKTRFEIYRTLDDSYYLLSVNSIRYEEVKKGKELKHQGETRSECFAWLNDNEIEKCFEIYI